MLPPTPSDVWEERVNLSVSDEEQQASIAHLQSPHRSTVRLEKLPAYLLLLRCQLVEGPLLLFDLGLQRCRLPDMDRPVVLDDAPKILDLLIARRLRVR